MRNQELSRFRIGDTELRYRHNPEDGRIELALAPAGAPERETVPEETLVPLAVDGAFPFPRSEERGADGRHDPRGPTRV